MKTTAQVVDTDEREQAAYEEFLRVLEQQFAQKELEGALFTTNADPKKMWDAYLSAFPEAHRQHYNCHACRHFIEQFGGLVTIGPDGVQTSALWDSDGVPSLMRAQVMSLKHAVEQSSVTGVFLSSLREYGQHTTGAWHHMALTPSRVFDARTQTAFQAMAEKGQDFIGISKALAEYPEDAVEKAFGILTSSDIYRAEKAVGVAQWFLDLHKARRVTKHAVRRKNLLWRAVVTAPPGFCHVRSTMIGTLLDDILSGAQYGAIKARWDAKMAPLQYQRPQAAPTAGAIAQAEKVVAQLNAEGALARRYAREEELPAIWRPAPLRPTPESTKGVFSHLKAKGDAAQDAPMDVRGREMSWEKFCANVLLTAQEIELLVPHGYQPFAAILTAGNPEAPPILQWDRIGKRNPFSWYLWANGSQAATWGLRAGEWCPVTAVVLQPTMWDEECPYSHMGQGAFLLLKGCTEHREDAGSGLFPEILRSEFHGVRSVIEAFSKSAKAEGREEGTACGMKLQSGVNMNHQVRVTTAGVRTLYTIDRWA